MLIDYQICDTSIRVYPYTTKNGSQHRTVIIGYEVVWMDEIIFGTSCTVSENFSACTVVENLDNVFALTPH